MTKAIDFKVNRELGPRLRLMVTKEPDLSQLLRSKVHTGPLKGAGVSAPPNWNGVCRPSEGAEPYPGRYIWDGESWVWKEVS
jgi:hypothetical protein